MNTRQPIQPTTTPAVLSLSFSASRNRFITGLSDGFRAFRTDNCLMTYQSSLPKDGGLGIVEALDDRYVAFVGGGRTSASSPNVVVFWDCVLDREINRFDFYEPVLGLRLSSKYMTVVLLDRTIVFEYRELEPQQQATPPPETEDSTDTLTASSTALRGPNTIKACHPTSSNPYALACLRQDTLVLPARSIGQVQLIPLLGGSKRVMRVHNNALRCFALSPDSTVLSTASDGGTLIRVFDTKTQDQLAEFRRGVDHAIIHSLAISDANRWLACTSDKGTVHVFDLRPSSAPTTETATPAGPPGPQHRKSQSQTTTNRSHRSPSSNNHDDLSILSPGSSIPQSTSHQASIQEYYGLRPPPLSSTPHNPSQSGLSALSALKSSPFAPRFMKDVRSVASAPFYTGDDPPHWQGGSAWSWTMGPDGTRRRVKNAVPPLAGEPSGRPRKGIVAFAPPSAGEREDEGAKLWVLGGGTDARWEVFDLVGVQGGGWTLVKGGFRKYLTRQFVD